MPRLALAFLLAFFAATATTENIRSFSLENGLEVYLLPRPRDVVAHMLFYRLGAADEEAGKSGLAHFLEHLMFRGLDENGEAIDMSARVARLGGRENALTSWDYVAYYQVVAKPHLDKVMALEAARMKELRLDEKQAAVELSVVLEERSLRVDSKPQSRLDEAAGATLFANHPYQVPIIGWRQEIAALTAADAMEFHGRYYKPQNAFVVLCGNLNLAEAKRLAEKYYGGIKATEHKPPPRPTEPSSQPPKRVSIIGEEVTAANWSRVWLLAKNPENEPKWHLLTQMLNAPKSGILHQRLVRSGLATSAGAWLADYLRDYAKFGLSVTPASGVDMADLERATEELLTKLPSLLDERRLRRAKAKIKGELLYQRDGVLSPAYVFGIALASGHTLEDVQSFEQWLDAVTVAELRQLLAEELLANDYFVTAVADNKR